MSEFTLSFYGAAGEVTGSCYLLEAGAHRILIDCGLFQGGADVEAMNAEAFAFSPGSIDAVILTHAHIDHSGRLPLLVKRGFRGRIHTHRATLDLARIMLKDSAFLAERDAERETRKRGRRGDPAVEPLYTIDDVASALGHFEPHEYGERIQLLPGISFCLRDAGHILGSAIIELWVDAVGIERKIVFSGDLGHSGAPLLKDCETIDGADVVLMESTYGDRAHRSWNETYAEMGAILADANAAKGNVLIPTFAVGRAQELLYLFSTHFDDWDLGRWQIFLDSPMAIEATGIYSKHTDLFDRETKTHAVQSGPLFSLPNLHLTETPDASMGINKFSSGAIILAGSGMCTGGRIRHHIQHNISKSGNHLMIVGFQARGTTGRALVDGVEKLRLWGEEHQVAAKVHTVGGLSAHAGADELVKWCCGFDGRPEFILVHGEPAATAALARTLDEDHGIRAFAPAWGAVYDLAALKWKKTHGTG